ncbi:hypothetical protein [Actinoplanes subtropicus]|uniref:hypothetical protein n=1 Tax=Actinoplanes subtropicus TaxID=543632 RepID=UPI0004C2EEA3|nr:hypothetical protein [Actinoplanes subtropicus]
MGKREIELRDAVAGALASARISGGQFRALMPVYGTRLGVALRVMRGEQIRRRRRTLAMAAIVATISGAAAAVAIERVFIHGASSSEPAPEPATDAAAEPLNTRQEAAFTNQ